MICYKEKKVDNSIIPRNLILRKKCFFNACLDSLHVYKDVRDGLYKSILKLLLFYLHLCYNRIGKQ